MSSVHDALFTPLAMPRLQVAERLIQVFRRHGIWFLNSVRGLRWNAASSEFAPNTDQELEQLPDLFEAVSLTAKWQAACFDLRFLQWAFELYLFERAAPDGSGGTSTLLSFPQSLYKSADADPVCSARWLSVMADVGLALDRSAMICGIEVLMVSAPEERLMARFHHYLSVAPPGSYQIHTALSSNSLLSGAYKKMGENLGFSEVSLMGQYRLSTRLKFDREVFQQSLAEI